MMDSIGNVLDTQSSLSSGSSSQVIPTNNPLTISELQLLNRSSLVTSSVSANSVYLSDLAWSSVSNGWGSVEKDKSNGEQGAEDGRTLTLNGVTANKGLGVHSDSQVTYELDGNYTTFTADIGIDDEVGDAGSVVFQVWADNSKLYDSGVVTGSSATKAVNVNVAGKQSLRLVVTDGGDDASFDHANWSNAKLFPSEVTPIPTPPAGNPNSVYLSDLAWSSASNGWGSVEKDKSNGEQGAEDGRTLTLNGVTANKGLGVHSDSQVTYELDGNYTTFAADIGIDDEVGDAGSVVFQVWADNSKLYDSGVVTGSSATKAVNVNVAGKQSLRLVVTDGGDDASFDHANWSNARLLLGAVIPTPLPTPLPIPTPTPIPIPPAGNAIAINVNWNTVVDTTTDLHFGLNAFQGFEAANANNAAYGSNMSYMSPGLLRYHHAGAMEDSKTTSEGLVDTSLRAWDTQKIVTALTASVNAFGNDQPERMINIPSWPSWMTDGEGYLARDQYDNFAKFSADLVKIVNKDYNFDVKYWEVLNEPDDSYFTQFYDNGGWGSLINPNSPDRIGDLITIYNKTAEAMKQVDPTIEIGGPAIARSDLEPFYVPFIQGTAKNLDFFTYHYYANGSASTPDSEVFKSPDTVGDYTQKIVQTLKDASPDRYIPAILDEYNISWAWDARDPRMTNNKGVVFDAMTIVEAIQNGADGTAAWNEKDEIYGKTSNEDALRPGAHLLYLLNTYFVGDEVASTSSNDGAVTTFAVKNKATGNKELLIINFSDKPQAIQANFTGWQPTQTSINEHEISSRGYQQEKTDWNTVLNGTFVVADYSVTVLDFAA